MPHTYLQGAYIQSTYIFFINSLALLLINSNIAQLTIAYID